MRRVAAALLVFCFAGCALIPQTTKNQVRGTVPVEWVPPEQRHDLATYLHGSDDVHRARQITTEHSSVEYYKDFSLGIIEVSDEGVVNPSQKKQVLEMLDKEFPKDGNGGLLVILIHGWHHSGRTCDRDLSCFRTVLGTFKKARDAKWGEQVAGQNVVGLFIGWRGESLPQRGLNTTTIWDRKDVAETLGRSSTKELLLEINEKYWEPNDEMTMVSVGHSLGGAMLFQAAKETLTGNVSDIEDQEIRPYRVARANCDREKALAARVKARRVGFGDLVVLVNPAIEASEYTALDADLYDASKNGLTRKALIESSLPYDKADPYPANQLPVLVALASLEDSAVGTIFPISRVVLAPVKPGVLFHASERLGIGHYAPHVTHHLGYKLPITAQERKDRDPNQIARVNCDCSMQTRQATTVDFTPIDLTKRSQEFGPGNRFTLQLTDQRAARGWDVNSPYMVIETEPKIMAGHSDIFNDYFVGFLSMFMDAYYTKYETVSEDCQFERPEGTQQVGW